ncbi:MAG TPA: hypothetical protein VHU44_04255 [Acidobacteriaceae bacterium]|nr:hypothetical protein [Acidobacteriaceae bacterium]
MTTESPNRLPRIFLLLSRMLLLLVGLLLVVIPWSERYCALDNFPQGQDLETNLLAFLALFGLMLLVAHLFRQSLAALFIVQHWISRLTFSSRHAAPYALARFAASSRHRAPPPSPLSALFNLPLQI